MREPDNIAALSALQPDYMGFIFWALSSRYVNETTPVLDKSIKKTGVFVDASVDYIQSSISAHQLQAVQLHGEETPGYCQLVQGFGVEVIKAFSVKDAFDFSMLEAYENSCDFFLFDTKGALPGGNGYTFDWSLIKGISFSKTLLFKWRNWVRKHTEIKELLNTDLPLHAIDVNSKFEVAPGIKKIEELTQFKNELYEL